MIECMHVCTYNLQLKEFRKFSTEAAISNSVYVSEIWDFIKNVISVKNPPPPL